jgi:hypothetical protein
VGKPVLLVATTAASGLKETIKFLEKTAVQWGAFPAGSIGRTVRNLNNPISSSEYYSFVKHLYIDKNKFRPKMSQLIFFQVQKVLAEKILPIDKEYWKEKNWLNKLYYFE